MLFSGYIKQKTSADNRGRGKPIQSSAGFMIHILRLLPFFGKSLDGYCQRRKQRFQKCYANLCRTFVDISSFVCFWLVFSLTYRTFGLGRGEYTKQTYCGKIRNMLVLFLCCKVTRSDISVREQGGLPSRIATTAVRFELSGCLCFPRLLTK